jgi:hypothetical protein
MMTGMMRNKRSFRELARLMAGLTEKKQVRSDNPAKTSSGQKKLGTENLSSFLIRAMTQNIMDSARKLSKIEMEMRENKRQPAREKAPFFLIFKEFHRSFRK